MRRVIPWAFLVEALFLVALPAGAAAQVPGLPLFHEPFLAPVGTNLGASLTIGLDRSSPGDDKAFSWLLGVRYRLATPLTFQASGGLYHPVDGGAGSKARLQTGAGFELLLKDDAIGSFSFLPETYFAVGAVGGVGYRALADSGTLVAVPLGMGLTWFLPVTATGAGPQIGLWVLPRGEVLHRSAGGTSQTEVTWGGSWGVAIAQGSGLGLNLGIDYRDVPGGAISLPTVPEWSVGAFVRLRR